MDTEPGRRWACCSRRSQYFCPPIYYKRETKITVMNQFLNKCRKQNNRLHALKIFQHELKIIHKEAFPRQANAVEIIFGNNFFLEIY
jgi:hypothetical protein